MYTQSIFKILKNFIRKKTYFLEVSQIDTILYTFFENFMLIPNL